MEQQFIGMKALRLFPRGIASTHTKRTEKYLIQTEACVDAEVPVWKDRQMVLEKRSHGLGIQTERGSEKHITSQIRSCQSLDMLETLSDA